MTIVVNPTPAHAQDITTGLVGHWKMDEAAGINVPDSSPSGFNGTFVNTPIWQPTGGRIDGALEFVPASATGVALPNGSFASLTTGTIAAWINWDGTAGVQQIFLQGGSPQWFEFFVNGGRLEIWSNATCSPRLVGRTGAGTLTAGTWHHVAYATSASGNTFYIDGVPSAATYTVGNATTNSFFNHCGAGAGTGYRIGRATSAVEYFDGEIDEVRVYSRRLSDADIAALHAYTGGALPCNAAHAGVMLYNTDESVLQYCNSTDWLDMGPKEAGGAGTCSGPAGVAGEVNYNFAHAVMQYCNGAHWINMGPIVANSGPGASVPTAGLVGHWEFDETTGTTAADSSGNGNNATLTDMNGATDWVAGLDGNALDFDGVDDHVITPITAGSQNQTISAWIYARSYAAGGNPDYVDSIIQKGEDNNVGAMGIMLSPVGGTPYMRSRNATGGAGDFACGGGSVPLNTWTLVTAVQDQAALEQRFYMNGVLASTCPVAAGFVNGPAAWWIGEHDYSAHPYNFDGLIDDVRIYNVALTNAQVAALYQGTGASLAIPTGCPAPGDICADGTMNAGTSPSGGIMYITRCDAGLTWDGTSCTGTPLNLPWSDDTSAANLRATGVTSTTDGQANTIALTNGVVDGTGDSKSTAGLQIHASAKYCADLSTLGHSDWYLPARDEFAAMAPNYMALNFNVPCAPCNHFHKTSTEDSAVTNVVYRLHTNEPYSPQKNDSGPGLSNIRCARKGTSIALGSCSAPAGVAGEMVYNADNDIMQYCNGTDWVGIR